MDRFFAVGAVESALRESEERYALLFKCAPAAMIAFDVDSLAILAVNPAAERQYGHSRDEFLGLTMRDLRPDDDPAPFRRAHAAMQAGHEIHGVYRHKRRDGSLLDVQLRTSTLPISGARVRLAVATDVTARTGSADVAHFLDNATSILTSSLDTSFVVRNLVALTVPRLGEWCVVHRPEGAELVACGFAHADPGRQRLVAQLLEHRASLPDDHPAMRAWRTGAIVSIQGDDTPLHVFRGLSARADPELAAALGASSALYVPVLGPSGVLAVLACVSDAAHPREPSTPALAAALAERAAIALSNAATHEAARFAMLAATQPGSYSPTTEEVDIASWVFESIPDSFLRVDCDWRVTYANGEAERLLQRPREELVGADLWTLFSEARGTRFEEEYTRAMRDQQSVTFEERYAPLDTWFEVRARPSSSGLAIFFRDVTAQHRARIQLDEQEASFQDFVESAGDLIHMIAPDGGILYANRAWREALGYTEADVARLTMAEVVAPDALERVRAAIVHAMQSDNPPEVEFEVVRKDGSRIVVRGRSNWRFVDGVPVSSRGIYRDVTAQVRTRTLLEKAQQTEAATHRAKTAFLDRMSHEMRTPLTAVIGFAAILQRNRGGRLNETDLQFVERIGVQGRNLLTLIEDVLSYADIESRRVNLDVAPVDLMQMLGEVIDLYAVELEMKAVQLSLAVPRQMAALETDASTLRRVLRYLLSDAISYVPGGRVVITVDVEKESGVPTCIDVRSLAAGAAEPDPAAVGTPQQPQLGLTIAESLAEVLGYSLVSEQLAPGVTENVLRLQARSDAALVGSDNSATTLHAIVQASPLPIIAFQPDWTVRLWNEAAETLYGWAPHEAVERRLPMLAIGGDDDFRELLRQALDAPHGIADVPAIHRRRDGVPVNVHVSLAPLRAPDGRLRGFLGIITDVSERTRLAEELRQAQRMEIVGRLAGGIAHDFNNLLTVVSAHAQFLVSDLPDGDPLVEDARAIQESVERAAALTRQLLLFARKQVTQRRVVDLNAKMADVDRILRRTIGSHIEFVTIPAAEPVLVDADPGQIEQVFMNLVLNARDAMHGGGALVVELSVDAADADGGRVAVISVSDTGVGMDAETQRRMFEPFFTTKGPDRGTGLGLSTVYGIVQESGGSIAVDSTVGAGTTVRVRLPMAGAGQDDVCVVSQQDGSALRGDETVLVVEDQDAVRAVAARVLRAYGYTVLMARHGHDALALLRKQPSVQLLLTDLVMPEMGGRELAARVRAMLPGVKVLFMSGYTEGPGEDADAALSAPLVRKPFTGDGLVRAVRDALG